MSLIRLNRNITSKLRATRQLSTALRNEDEYVVTPQYPPILDLSFEKRLERKKAALHEEIKLVKTVEEKQIKLNMPRFYGFKSYMLVENTIPYDNLPLAQHVTKTHLIINNNLPDYYKNFNVDETVNNLKLEIEEAVLIELEGYKRTHELRDDLSKGELEDFISEAICKSLNRILVNKMHNSYAHLSDVQVDLDPRIETSWLVGGMIPPKEVKSSRRGMEWMKQYENDPVDRWMVYHGFPSLALRSEVPLNSVVPFSEAENPDLKVPFFQYDPRVSGIFTEYKHIANVPGFWAGDPYRFGLLSYHKRGYMLNRSEHYRDAEDDKEALHRQGILASFGWLSAQANLLGFNTFNDITYPLVTQTIITNGKLWSFYVYQMNTMLLHSKNITNNPKTNICWGTEELQLYQDIQDGKVIGLNEDVLKLLLKFYVNAPESRLGVNLTPYLSSEENVSADYEDDEKREWLEREYKYLVSNRPRHHEVDEIYSWEKIYKIDHKTRFMDKRLRPFELMQNPYQRRLDDRTPNYIPRKFRPDLPRWKGKYKKEFFP